MNKTKSFPGNPKKNDRNSANEENMHTHTHPPTHTHTRKLINITVERVSMDENI